MNARVPHTAVVEKREILDPHLIRLSLRPSPDLQSTGIPDEWVGIVIPGQFQSRYYTIRSLDELLLVDVVVHDDGLVTSWASGDCVGDEIGLSAPKGSYLPGADAQWVVLAGDLTALPAMARIAETSEQPVIIHAEVPNPIDDYLPSAAQVHWHQADAGQSQLAGIVESLDWPTTPGYFWMAGESAQMREIRRFVRRDLEWPSSVYDVMGYWSQGRGKARPNVQTER